VSLEGRPSNRVVTIVHGLSGSPGDLRSLARTLKAACATGGSLDGTTLELQGDHKEKVEEWLESKGHTLRTRRGHGR
jgi:translation initiation factor 1